MYIYTVNRLSKIKTLEMRLCLCCWSVVDVTATCVLTTCRTSPRWCRWAERTRRATTRLEYYSSRENLTEPFYSLRASIGIIELHKTR